MSVVLAGMAGALVAWGFGLIAWSAAPRRIEGWTVCDFGPFAKTVALFFVSVAAFAGVAGAHAEAEARVVAFGVAGGAGFVGLYLAWRAFFYRCRWDIDGLSADNPPFPRRVIAWGDMERAGWSPLSQRFWVADAGGRKVWWSPMMRGWQPLWRAVERRLSPTSDAPRGPDTPSA